MKGSESAYSPATAMAAAADNHDGGVGELQGSAWAQLSHAARNLVSEMTALSSLVEMSDAHHEAESSMLNMIMMNRSAPNYIKQLDVEEQQLRHLQQAPPPAAQPHHLMNRIPASPSPHAPAGSATSYINLPGAGIGASRHLSKSVPSSPTFANSLHMHHLLASAGGAAHGAGRAGNPFSLGAKDLSAHLKFSSSIPSSAGLPLLMKTASTSSSMLTASLDLASCTSNLAAAAAAQLRSASSSGDHYPVQQGEIHAAAPASSTLMMMQSPDDTTTSNDYLITLPQYNDHATRLTSATSTSATTANFSGDIPSPLMTSRTNSQNSQQVGVAKKRRVQHNLLSSSSTALTSTGVDRVTSAAADQADQVGQSRALANNIQQDEAAAPLEAADMSTNNSPINFNHHDGVDHLNAPVMKTSSTDLQEPAQPPAPKQDYIHVRARRGQATDSHSLAERVRREKISERMKFLQDLVPGCNKITGKAVMLDEIINYVQSLQRQVEFLSMKLSTVSPPSNRYDAAMLVNHVESQPMHQISQASMASNLSHIHDQHPTHQHVHQHNHQLPMPLLLDVQQPHVQQDSSTINGNQVWEDELQSLVQMGYPTTLS